jgi:hypothetical protein
MFNRQLLNRLLSYFTIESEFKKGRNAIFIDRFSMMVARKDFLSDAKTSGLPLHPINSILKDSY